MNAADPTNEQLLAYVDELLPPAQMAAVEKALRRSARLRERTASVARRRDQGGHTLGEIWRRQRLSCPNRGQLGSYVTGNTGIGMADYIEFHLDVVGCRFCEANLEDIRRQVEESPDAARRRRKFFETSAGYLRPRE